LSLLRNCALVLLAAMSLVGCGGGSGDDTAVVPGVTYTLQAAADQGLPATVADEIVHTPDGDLSVRFVVREGWVELLEDGRYKQHIDYVSYVDGNLQPILAWNDTGRYSTSGKNIHFESSYIENRRYDGNLTEGGVTLNNDITGEELKTVTYTFTK